MNIIGVQWTNNTHKIIAQKDVYVEGSYFEDFLMTDSSACISLESKIRIDITKSSFKNIINLQIFTESIYNGAVVYSSSATIAFFNQSCFIECGSSHGHSFGCFGTSQSSFNSSIIVSQKLLGNHPSFFADFPQSSVYEINITKTNQESIYFCRSKIANIHFLSCVDMDVSDIELYDYAIYVQSLTSCSHIAVRNVTGMKSVIHASDRNIVDSLFLDSIGESPISEQSIIINELSYINSDITTKRGSATVLNLNQVSSPEIWFQRPINDCYFASFQYSFGYQPLRIAAVALASLLNYKKI